MEALRIYRALAGAYVRSRMQYKASTLGRAATFALIDAVPVALLAVVLARFPDVAGWRWPELALLYALSQCASAAARMFSWQLDHFDEYILSGELDIFLTRPLPPLWHLLAVRFDIVQIGRLVIGIFVLVLAFRLAAIHPTPAHVGLTILAVIGGAILLFSLTLIVASLSFWYTRTGKLQDIVQSGTRSFAEYPLPIYPRGVQLLLVTVLPLALATYHPALELLGRASSPLAFASLPAGLLFLSVSVALWRRGLHRYQSTGS
jgi:viologen exporter family transport system permease protein